MTRQEVKDNVKAWFSRPNAEFGYEHDDHEFAASGTCVYRGNDDPTSEIRCAFGCLIPDEEYDPSMENVMADTVIDDNTVLSEMYGEHALLILRIQELHDQTARRGGTVEEFVEKLDYFWEQLHEDPALEEEELEEESF